MAAKSFQVTLLVCLVLLLNGGCSVGCIEAERKALLGFKAGIMDPANVLSSWDGEDCCRWLSVHCDNRTGHVVRLDFQDIHFTTMVDWRILSGEISPSLLDLKHLRYLDFSWHCLNFLQIPTFLGSFKHLKHLDLSNGCFTGVVPRELGNLTRLAYLDLSFPYNSTIDDARWLSGLSSLQYLGLNGIDMGGVTNLIQALNMLPSLQEVYLSMCGLSSLPQSLPHLNFTSLSIIDMSLNNFNFSIPQWLFNVHSLRYVDLSASGFTGAIPPLGNEISLEYLDLSSNPFTSDSMPRSSGYLCNLKSLKMDATFNEFVLAVFGVVFSGCVHNSLNVFSFSYSGLTGKLPDWLSDLRNLTTLDLSSNNLSGPVPASLGSLSLLQSLQLQSNTLNGPIPESFGQLSQLVSLDLSGNSFTSVISEAHLANLSRLNDLKLHGTSLALNLSSNWVPPFQLQNIDLSFCHVGPLFPMWLHNQYNISTLQMPGAGISDSMPDWFWNMSFSMTYLDLTGNEITGRLPSRLNFQNREQVGVLLGSNRFKGYVPLLPSNVAALDLSNNLLSGTIPQNFSDAPSRLALLSLSSNSLDGEIPLIICNLSSLAFLDLSTNYLTGEIPDCWQNNIGPLMFINLANNKLRGAVPDSIGSSHFLEVLDLSNNSLDGGFPPSLRNCTDLVTLALGHNKLSGRIPVWVGEVFPRLKVLLLRSNELSGDLPPLSNLPFLHMLDLSNNNFTGSIPRSFGNFTGMIVANKTGGSTIQTHWESVVVNISIVTKGREYHYGYILSLLILMDLSANNLSGGIPDEISNLDSLQSLNLSDNKLTGTIPEKIRQLKSLESLDLSRNKLMGLIPSSIASLDFLQRLNLSYNNLSGKIPFRGHLTSFGDPSTYAGNPNLCGAPLATNCTDGETSQSPPMASSDGEYNESFWIWIGMVLGFVVGFWTVCGMLVLKKTWRSAYFRFSDDTYDVIYVTVAVTWNRLRRNVLRRPVIGRKHHVARTLGESNNSSVSSM